MADVVDEGTLLNIPDVSLVLLPFVYVPRSYVSGAPYPIAESDFNTAEFQKATLVLRASATSGALKQGASLTRREAGQFVLGLAMMTTAIASGARIPAIPYQWSEVRAAEKVNGHGAQIAANHAMPVVSPWKCGTPSGSDDHRRTVLKYARATLKALRSQKLHSTTMVDGTSYLTDVELGDLTPGSVESTAMASGKLVAIPMLVSFVPAILFTTACIAAIGISQYFKADVEKQRLYYDFANATPLAGVHAMVELELARMKAEIETGKPVAPSPVALKLAEGLKTRIEQMPGAGVDLKPLAVAGGLTIGGLAAAWLARRYWFKHKTAAAAGGVST